MRGRRARCCAGWERICSSDPARRQTARPVTWTALVPLKQGVERKTRLAAALDAPARAALGDRMAAHVVGVLRHVPAIGRVVVLSPRPVPELATDWQRDAGRGLNAELEAARAVLGSAPLLVVHADLPLLTQADVAALLVAAGHTGVAIAPDRHDLGTNAVAIDGASAFRFRFGPGSLERHAAQMSATLVRRDGLSMDIDTPGDLAAFLRKG